jgi:hypothetical protein
MMIKKLMRDLVDAVDGAGREFKQGFSGAFRKRGGKHRADADAIRGVDRRASNEVPRHRADPPKKPTSHAKDYDIREEARSTADALKHTPRHADPDYNAARDFGLSVGKSVTSVPGDIGDEIKGIPGKVPGQLVEELYEDAIGQDDPDKYGRKGEGDMKFLAPAGEAGDLAGLSNAEIAARFGLDPGSLDGATFEVKEVPGSRFVSIEISPAAD